MSRSQTKQKPLVHSPGEVALGKKLGRVEDPRTFKLKAFLRRALPTPPASSNVGGTTVSFPMFGNDRYGCCTFASHGHRIVAQEKSTRQHEVVVTEEDVLAGYSAVTGFDKKKPETDNGAYMLDVLNYMRTNGIGKEKDGSAHTIHAFVEVPRTRNDLKLASWMFGGVYLGLWLPESAQRQVTWDASPTGSEAGEYEPGSWGGHAVHMVGYSATQIALATWAERKKATWEFLDHYCDEAYAVISEDFLYGTGRTPQGFNVEKLEQTLLDLDS